MLLEEPKKQGRFVPVPNFAPVVVAAALGIAVLIVAVLLWSDREVDRIARQRDRSIVSLVVDQSFQRIAHTQESSTVWDSAVLQLRKPQPDLDWIDRNLGIWFHSYANFGEVYIVSPTRRLVYAMRDGRREGADAYLGVARDAESLLERLRAASGATTRKETTLSPGLADFALVRGRPAIISAKPVVSDSGELVQAPGSEAYHVAVVFLDHHFFDRVGSQYGLAGMHYSIAPSSDPADNSIALRNRRGETIGYLTWRPFAPGSQVTGLVGPVLVLVLLLSTMVIATLSSRLVRRTHDLEESRSEAEHQAMHDGLTGLCNRAMFDFRLEEALARTRRRGSQVAVLYIDLDRFKQVNDSLGHPAGDALICKVAQRLLAEVRSYDLVARLGGDEFAILVDDPEDRASLDHICQRIVYELERPFNIDGAQAFIGASIGVAIAPENGTDRTELTRKADIALYRAKADGRSRYVRFDEGMDDDVKARESTERDLRQALADCDGQLRVHYQPTYSMRSGLMTGVEALLRWQHPEKGLVTPDAFIRLAEECGLIEVLGQWVLRRAAQDAVAWPGLRVAVNVSPVQVRDRNFAATVRTVLAETGLEPERLEVEITETALMETSSDVTASLRELRRLGVSCALDDFGTGYSSLSHIRDIAVDRIKIDKSFVQAVHTAPGAALVEAIVGLARANGLHLTAEGVENATQYAFLQKLGCHEVQGFLLSRPVPADHITALREAASQFQLDPVGKPQIAAAG